MIIYYTGNFTGGREESRRLLEKVLTVHTGDGELAKTLIGALKKGEHGKPYIEGFSCFSISHTGSIWAVLIADRECGLDIQFGKGCDIRAISERFFAPEDAAEIAELCIGQGDDGSVTAENGSAVDAFFRIWTRREALTKALGSTVYDPDLPAVSEGAADINGIRYELTDIALQQLWRGDSPQLYAAICIEGKSSGSIPEIRNLENERY